MANGIVDIIKNGYVYTNNFTVSISAAVDVNGAEVVTKKENVQFTLTNTNGINVSTVIPSIGTFDVATSIWSIPELTSDAVQYLSFMATVTDEAQGPYEVVLDIVGTYGDSNTLDNRKVITLGGITRGDLRAELDGLEGPVGPANAISLGTVSTGTASANLTGTSGNQILNLVFPEPLDTINIGTVTTLAEGAAATATITGTTPNKLLNLGLPVALPVPPTNSGVTDYNALTNLPTLFDGDYDSLTNQPNVAILSDDKVGFSETSTLTETSVAYIDIINEDLSSSDWQGNVSGNGLLNNMAWSQGVATEVVGDFDAEGRQYYNVVDTGSVNTQSNWHIINGDIGGLIPTGTVQAVSFSVQKASLTKPMMIFISSSGGLGFLDQPWFEVDSTGTVTEGTNSGTICPNGMSVVDNGTHWEFSLDILGAAQRQFGILPVLRAADGGAFSSQSVGSVNITAPYIKTGNVGGIVTTTEVTILTELQSKHVAPTVPVHRGSSTAPNEVAFAIVMGQSNAAGQNSGSSPNTNTIDCVYTMSAGNYTWQPYVGNDNAIYSTNGANQSNPLTELARAWQLKRDADASVPDLYIINCSFSGTGFGWSQTSASQWDPFLRRNGVNNYLLPEAGVINTNRSLFWTANKAIKEGLLQFAMEGQKAFHIGTIWNQWESDGVRTADINRYPANLQLIRKMVDKELGLVDADFYAWRPNNERVSLPTMQSHFDNFELNNDNVFLIRVQDMPEYNGISPNFGIFENDNIHYTPEVQVRGANFVLENGYFSEDASGNSTKRAREVVMNIGDLVSTTHMSANGSVYETKVDNTGAQTSTLMNNQL
jgi:hypothetical protein